MKTTSAVTRGRNAYDNEKVSAWADAYGIWHVKIIFPAPGYDRAELKQHADRVRAKARRSVRHEIAQRQGEQHFTCRIEPEETDQGADGVTRSITYREVTTD